MRFWNGVVTAVLACGAIKSGYSQNVLTQAYDNARSGAYTFETKLTPAAVGTDFGELFERNIDGDVQAQVLYVRNVALSGSAPTNLFYVATATNKLYAFDAGSTDTDPAGGLVWMRQIDSTRKLIVGGDDGEVCGETFNGSVGITGTPVIDPASGILYAVTWRPALANLNLFTASPAGAVQLSGWLDGSVYLDPKTRADSSRNSSLRYHPWSPLSSNSFVTSGQPVTALWSNATHLDLFVVSTDGGVYSSWWEADKGGQSWQWFPIGQTGIASPGQKVAAQWSTPAHLDIFFTSANGTVETTSWEAASGWQPWSPIGPAQTAVAREPVTAAVTGTRINLFVTAPDGTIMSTWRDNPSSAWQSWFAIGASGTGVPGSEVTAIPNGAIAHLDLFVASADGTVNSNWWEPAPGWNGWFAISPSGTAAPGQAVSAVRNGPAHMDVFVTASDGTIQSTWWEPTPKWHVWFPISPAGTAAAGGAVTAAWRGTTHMDVFVAANDGTVTTTWWEATQGWQTWSAVGAAGAAQPLQTVTALWPLPGHVTDIGGNYIHAIDIATGLEESFSPIKIQVTAPGNPALVLDPRCHRNRPGLLLSGGVVYAGFSCLTCDRWCPGQPFTGWVVGYNASNLSQVAVFNTASGTGQAAAGIWQSGSGLAADSAGNIYFQTGNGEPASASASIYSDSFIKLTPTTAAPGLAVSGSFTPPNAQILSCGDTDLGAGGPALLPGGMLVGGGKEGKFFVLNSASMQATQQFQAFQNTWHADATQPPCLGPPGPPAPQPSCNPPFVAAQQFPVGGTALFPLPSACYVDPSRYQYWEPFGPNIHGSPVVWTLPQQGYALVYKMPEKDYMKSFRFDLNTLRMDEVSFQTSAPIRPADGMPGGFASLSANVDQGGIVWVSFPTADSTAQAAPGGFVALDAISLQPIWQDSNPVTYAKFNPATIADGKVFRPTYAGKIIVYGLRAAPSSP